MKSADTLRRDTLRFVLSAVHNEEVSRRADADDALVRDVLGKQAKMRRDSIDAFRGGGRLDLADKEEQELAIIQGYLPTPLHDEAVRELAQRAIAATGASGKKDLGKVMAALRAETKDRADGKTVARIVNELLS
jgi:uncharacterized protein YqeY